MARQKKSNNRKRRKPWVAVVALVCALAMALSGIAGGLSMMMGPDQGQEQVEAIKEEVRRLEREMEEEGEDAETLHRLGELYRSMAWAPEGIEDQEGYMEKYVEVYERLSELEETEENFHTELGGAYQEAAQWVAQYRQDIAGEERGEYLEEACEAYLEAVEQEPESSENHLNLGEAYMQLAEWKSYQEGEEVEEARGEYLYEALAAYEEAHDLEPENVQYLSRLGEIYNQLGDWKASLGEIEEEEEYRDKSIEIYEQVLDMAPGEVQNYMSLYEAYSRMDKEEEAEQVVSQAEEVIEENLETAERADEEAENLYYRAWLKQHHYQDIDEAMEILEEVVEEAQEGTRWHSAAQNMLFNIQMQQQMEEMDEEDMEDIPGMDPGELPE